MTYPDQKPWRDKFVLCPFNRGGGRSVRYYQENAINNVLNAIADGEKRILLTMEAQERLIQLSKSVGNSMKPTGTLKEQT